MNKILTAVILILLSLNVSAQREYNLTEVIERAKEISPRAKQAETRRENRYWQYRLFRSNYNPQLVLTGNVPGINRNFIGVEQPDGTVLFRRVQNSNSDLNLGFRQPITLTGGEVSVNTGLNRFTGTTQPDPDSPVEIFNKNWSANVFNITFIQPLFAFNELKWDKKVEPLRYEESKKNFVEEMEFISRRAVELYFNYLDAQIGLQVAQLNQANNDTIYNIEKGRYDIGNTSKDKLLQVELQLLTSEQAVASAELGLQTARLGLNSFIGLNDTSFALAIPETVPEFSIDLEEALRYARANRSDYVEFERRTIEAEREVARARGARFRTDLRASFGQAGANETFDGAYENVADRQTVNLTLNVPILTWGRNEARMKTALANKQLTDYTIAQELQNFDQEIITLVSRMDVLRLQLKIAKRSDNVANERYTVAQNRYLIGKIDITNLNLALRDKDDAKRRYLNALRDFWTAYFDLRRLTLYDFSTNNLLYREEL